jgi:hypothetical protein
MRTSGSYSEQRPRESPHRIRSTRTQKVAESSKSPKPVTALGMRGQEPRPRASEFKIITRGPSGLWHVPLSCLRVWPLQYTGTCPSAGSASVTRPAAPWNMERTSSRFTLRLVILFTKDCKRVVLCFTQSTSVLNKVPGEHLIIACVYLAPEL